MSYALHEDSNTYPLWHLYSSLQECLYVAINEAWGVLTVSRDMRREAKVAKRHDARGSRSSSLLANVCKAALPKVYPGITAISQHLRVAHNSTITPGKRPKNTCEDNTFPSNDNKHISGSVDSTRTAKLGSRVWLLGHSWCYHSATELSALISSW